MSSRKLKVFLAGEGRNELGGWYDAVPYRSPERRGVIEALLRHVAGADGYEVTDALVWGQIRKYRVRLTPEDRKLSAEELNVRRLYLHAKEAGADIVATTRDRDRDPERQRRFQTAIERVTKAEGPAVAGEMAVEAIEAWILSLLGDERAERHTDPKLALEGRVDGTQAMVDVIESAWAGKPCPSLDRWLTRAQAAVADARGNDA